MDALLQLAVSVMGWATPRGERPWRRPGACGVGGYTLSFRDESDNLYSCHFEPVGGPANREGDHPGGAGAIGGPRNVGFMAIAFLTNNDGRPHLPRDSHCSVCTDGYPHACDQQNPACDGL